VVVRNFFIEVALAEQMDVSLVSGSSIIVNDTIIHYIRAGAARKVTSASTLEGI
jgi:hypothetical protein